MSRAAIMKPYSHDISDCHDSDADIDEDDSWYDTGTGINEEDSIRIVAKPQGE